MNVVAVVLNWRRPRDTIACLASLRTHAPDTSVIVVDNASGDDSVSQISAAFPSIRVIANERNDGYAGGNNVGLRAALDTDADAVLILNNDVVVRPGFLEPLVARLGGPHRIVAPVSLRADDPSKIDFLRARVDLRNCALIAEHRDETMPVLDPVYETDYCTGSAMLIDAALLRQIGLFDEQFFLVWEDVDLCLRARRVGVRCHVVTASQVLHGRSVSFGGDGSPLFQYFFARNSFLITEKHLRWPQRARTLRMIERRYRTLAASTSTDTGVAIAAGLRDGLARSFGPSTSF